MVVFLGNAESILHPQWWMNSVTEELGYFSNVYLGTASLIPPLSVELACRLSYDIYNNNGHSDTVRLTLRRDPGGGMCTHRRRVPLVEPISNPVGKYRHAVCWNICRRIILSRVRRDNALA